MDSRKLSRSRHQAAMQEVSGPVVAIALVLISVFVPVAFLGGLHRQFYRAVRADAAVSWPSSRWSPSPSPRRCARYC